MASRVLFACAFLAVLAIVSAQTPFAMVKVFPSNLANGDAITGTVVFSKLSNGSVWVDVQVSGLTSKASSQVGIHVHQYADMVSNIGSSDSFEPGSNNFGAHFVGNGNSSNFGCPETHTFPDFRSGCLGNWQVDGSGVISMQKMLHPQQFTLEGMGSPIGRGLIIHGATDPCDGTTNWGPRIAGGVIGLTGKTSAKAYYLMPGDNSPISATCRLVGVQANSTIRGSVWLQQTSATSIMVVANVTGVQGENIHSMHIHEIGNITDTVGALASGGHFWINTNTHGFPTDTPRHEGDLGRIRDYDAAGNLWYANAIISQTSENNQANYNPSLWSENAGVEILSVFGRTIILHEGRDEGCAAPTTNGNAGKRIAQCVIGYALNSQVNVTNIIPKMSFTPQPFKACEAPVLPMAPNQAASLIASALFLLVCTLVAVLF